MKKNIFYITVLIIMCLSACKKNTLPKDETGLNSPEFYFKCDVNGTPVNLQAGVNNYYMFSAHSQDSNNVYVYRGDLKQKDCNSNCFYGISIQINDCKQSILNSPMKPDSALYVAPYQFNDGVLTPLYYTSTFYSTYSATPKAKYNWAFADATPTQTTSSIIKTFKANTTQTISLTYSDTLATSSTTWTSLHQNIFKIGNPFQANIVASRDLPLNNLKYTYGSNFTGGLGSYSYLWEFGDGTTSNLSSPSHSFPSGAYRDYRTKLTLTTNNSNETYTCATYYQSTCYPNLVCNANYSANFVGVQNTKGLSAITIKVIDSKGVEYSSSQLNQPSTTNFEIISVENYKLNEKNEATKKIKIKFNCTLQSGSNILNINNGEAVIAVSYK